MQAFSTPQQNPGASRPLCRDGRGGRRVWKSQRTVCANVVGGAAIRGSPPRIAGGARLEPTRGLRPGLVACRKPMLR